MTKAAEDGLLPAWMEIGLLVKPLWADSEKQAIDALRAAGALAVRTNPEAPKTLDES